MLLELALAMALEGVQPSKLLGRPAPDFALPGVDGRTYRLADYRGKQPVVLVWFPALET